MHWNGLNSDLKHLLKHLFRGEGYKNGKKQAIKFDRKCKNAKHRCHQQIYYKLKNRGEAIQ